MTEARKHGVLTDELPCADDGSIREVFFNLTERHKYEQMWQFDQYRKVSPAEAISEEIVKHFPVEDDANGKAMRMIDFGCGTGRILDRFIGLGYDVLGVDIAHNCLDTDMRNRVPLLVADLTSLPGSVQGDFGICVDVLEHLPTAQMHAALANIARAAPRGCFIRVTNLPEPPFQIDKSLHLTLWDCDEWADALVRHFRVVHFSALREDSKLVRYSFFCVK